MVMLTLRQPQVVPVTRAVESLENQFVQLSQAASLNGQLRCCHVCSCWMGAGPYLGYLW